MGSLLAVLPFAAAVLFLSNKERWRAWRGARTAARPAPQPCPAHSRRSGQSHGARSRLGSGGN
jgi:hypothetical protein